VRTTAALDRSVRTESSVAKPPAITVAALFAGIGGIEIGLEGSGFRSAFFCERDPHAVHVLRANWPDAEYASDIGSVGGLPRVDMVTAGFPCQDLSMAGGKVGIRGNRSNLVAHVFRLLKERSRTRPRWVLIENVAYMLRLEKGRAMWMITRELEKLGYRWAYRVVDPRGFGIPQRRNRVLLLADREGDPAEVLLSENTGSLPLTDDLQSVQSSKLYGFYWTEGLRGIGWAESSVPPIKGGSGLGIPSPPAVWNPKNNFIGTIALEDAERLQGFPAGWTTAATADGGRIGVRWRLVGNAVCTAMTEWVGRRMRGPGSLAGESVQLSRDVKWPAAAFGCSGARYGIDLSMWPVRRPYVHLKQFLKHPLAPLSQRAAAGYLSRLKRCPIKVHPRFFSAVQELAGESA
jgi:DNA (cytosine-5)-methyltransferase 1